MRSPACPLFVNDDTNVTVQSYCSQPHVVRVNHSSSLGFTLAGKNPVVVKNVSLSID